jgi:hypothetical protein
MITPYVVLNISGNKNKKKKNSASADGGGTFFARTNSGLPTHINAKTHRQKPKHKFSR